MHTPRITPEIHEQMHTPRKTPTPKETPEFDERDTPKETPDIDELYGATKHTIDRLGTLYSMELSAARSYDMALASPDLAPYRDTLGYNRRSHEERIRLLCEQIQLAGGDLPQTSSISDSLLELLEDAAVAVSASNAFHVLERREDRWLNKYKQARDKLVRQSRLFVEEQLLPRQLQSHGVIHAFKRSN